MSTQPSITCPECGRTSYHPDDIAQGYCGHCHWWTSDPRLGPVFKEVYPNA
jgi:ribosomal protein L37E